MTGERKSKRAKRAPAPEIRGSQADSPRAGEEAPPSYPAERRDGGRWTKDGPSPCPGGRGLASVRLARLVRQEVDPLELVRKMKGIATGRARFTYVEIGRVKADGDGPPVDGPITYTAGPSPELQKAAAETLKQWGWGKGFPAAADLESELAAPAKPGPVDAGAILQEAAEVAVGLLRAVKGHVEAGALPDPELVQGLRGSLEALANIHKQQREVERQDAVSRMALEQIVAETLARLPVEALRAELERRQAVAA